VRGVAREAPLGWVEGALEGVGMAGAGPVDEGRGRGGPLGCAGPLG
jgi:hypothetical protein